MFQLLETEQSGHSGSPRTRSAVPMLVVVAENRSRFNPEVADAQPSATSPAATVAFRWTVMFETAGTRSGSPPAGGWQVQSVLQIPEAQPVASLPSQASTPSRMLFPHTVGGETVSWNAPFRPPQPSTTM